jgi:hypothetical protein
MDSVGKKQNEKIIRLYEFLMYRCFFRKFSECILMNGLSTNKKLVQLKKLHTLIIYFNSNISVLEKANNYHTFFILTNSVSYLNLQNLVEKLKKIKLMEEGEEEYYSTTEEEEEEEGWIKQANEHLFKLQRLLSVSNSCVDTNKCKEEEEKNNLEYLHLSNVIAKTQMQICEGKLTEKQYIQEKNKITQKIIIFNLNYNM